MIVPVCFIVGFTLLQFLIVLTNLFLKDNLNNADSDFNGLVSILIPARNEELNIESILTGLQSQDYKNIEILVFDDQSTDRTGEIVRQFIKQDNRIKLIESGGLPPGWLGKNHACHELSKRANGKYFLFVDADVRLSKNIIIQSIATSEKHNLGLLSIFPIQEMLTFGERITVPNMNLILLSLLPLILVRKTKYQSLTAANGQFMLFKAADYQQLYPHEKMKGSKVEDMEIARYFKQLNIRIACTTGDKRVSCRMYTDFNEALEGFSKNIISFFGNSFILAFLFWLITTAGIIVVYLGTGTGVFLLYLVLFIIIRILISLISRQNILINFLNIFPQQVSLGIILLKAVSCKLKNEYQWKGRNIS